MSQTCKARQVAVEGFVDLVIFLSVNCVNILVLSGVYSLVWMPLGCHLAIRLLYLRLRSIGPNSQ
eukprot:7289263-Pyramimonas_sp.AAC.1